MGKGIERINNHKSYGSILCKRYGGFASFLKHERFKDFGQTILVLQKTKQYFES